MAGSPQINYQLFPLETFLHEADVAIEQISNQQQSVLLLSQITQLDRNLVEQLEQAGIYDTSDFFAVGEDLQKHFGMNEDQFNHLESAINTQLFQQSQLPTLIKDLPNNYALITIRQSPVQNELGLLWRGLRYKISQHREDYWNPIKHQVDQLLIKMGQPQLIGGSIPKNAPHWMYQIEHLSEYLTRISRDETILEIALQYGLPLDKLEIHDLLDQHLLSLAYLIEFSLIHQQ